MAITADPTAVAAAGRVRRRLWIRPALHVDNLTVVASIAWIALVLVAALVPSLLTAGADPTLLRPGLVFLPPGAGALLGTDNFGRSVLTELIYGARPALIIGVAATVVGSLGGGIIGSVAGFVGGRVDLVVGRLIDVLICFPGVLLALVITSALGSTTTNLIIAVGVGEIAGFSRIMRGQVMSVRSRLYVEAARSSGLHPTRILARHVLPNSLAPLVVVSTVSVGNSVVAAAALSYLGIGPVRLVPDWGQLLAAGQPYLQIGWWISTFPGIAITMTVISVSLCGDWLRDHLDAD